MKKQAVYEDEPLKLISFAVAESDVLGHVCK